MCRAVHQRKLTDNNKIKQNLINDSEITLI